MLRTENPTQSIRNLPQRRTAALSTLLGNTTCMQDNIRVIMPNIPKVFVANDKVQFNG